MLGAANAEGIQIRDCVQGRQAGLCAGEAGRTWRQFPHPLSSRHAGWADLGYTALVIRLDHKNPAHELVTNLENV